MLHASSSGVPWKVKADGSCYGGAAGLSKSAAAQPLDSADHLSAEVHHWRPEFHAIFFTPPSVRVEPELEQSEAPHLPVKVVCMLAVLCSSS